MKTVDAKLSFLFAKSSFDKSIRNGNISNGVGEELKRGFLWEISSVTKILLTHSIHLRSIIRTNRIIL